MANPPLPSSSSTEKLLLHLLDPQLTEKVLHELSMRRDTFQEMAPLLWRSYGIIPFLLREITKVYRCLSPPTLTFDQSKRVCNAILLLECVASHDETRRLFLQAQITMYILPLINTSSRTNAFENLRHYSLRVIRELVKVKDQEVIRCLIENETVPICFNAIDYGTELSKPVATFIIQKILEDDLGLEYIGNSEERFFKLNAILTIMVVEIPSPDLLKTIIHCYHRLIDNWGAHHALQTCFPMRLNDATLTACLHNDHRTMLCLHELLQRVGV